MSAEVRIADDAVAELYASLNLDALVQDANARGFTSGPHN